MNIDLKSAVIGLAFGLAVCGGWYAGSTRPVIQKLVEEKAQAVGRANQLEQEKAQYKTAAEHWFEIATVNQQGQPQPAPQDPAVAALNLVRPGLGTLVGKAAQAWQQSHPATQQDPHAGKIAMHCAPGSDLALHPENYPYTYCGEPQ